MFICVAYICVCDSVCICNQISQQPTGTAVSFSYPLYGVNLSNVCNARKLLSELAANLDYLKRRSILFNLTTSAY